MQIGLSGVIQKRMKGITLQPAEGEELVFAGIHILSNIEIEMFY